MELSFVFLELLIGFLLQGVNVNSEGIRGTAGIDYPTFYEIPVTTFRCSDQKYTPGFYADPETGCQVFHYCYNNRQESYLCPTGTIFNQAILACDYWYSSDCVGAASLYSVNNNYHSRALSTDFGVDGASGDFGVDAAPTSEPETSNVHYEALNVMPTENDTNKLNKVVSNLEKYSNEADETNKLNIAANADLHEDNEENIGQNSPRKLQSPTEDGAEESTAFDNTKAVDEYDRYPQSVASSGPDSLPSKNMSESVYEKLADLNDANLRLPKNENDREYTEEQLRGLIEEIRDYEHEMRSERDKNYMFRPYFLEKDTEDDFSGLNESEFNSKLTENSNYDDSKINSEGESEKFVPEFEYDYDDSNANEDRLRYLHKLRERDLHVSYPSNLNQNSKELDSNEDSSQQSQLPNGDASTNEESFQAPDDMGIFSKRLFVTEGTKSKISRRKPIYVTPEVITDAPKLLPISKRPRGYPFGIQKTDVENSIVTEADVGNITLNRAVEETEQTETPVILNPDTSLDTASLNIYTDQTENRNVEEGYVSETKHEEAIDVGQGNVYETATDSADEQSESFQYQNSYVFEGNEYDLNTLRDSEQSEWSYDYSQNYFSDFESQEHPGISRIEYLRNEERLPSDEEYESSLFEANVENIPESTHGGYFSRREYPGQSFDTLESSNTFSQLNKNQRNMYYPEVYSENEEMNANSKQTYQEELEKRIPTYSSDAYTNFNENGDAGKEKEFGSLHEKTYRDEISGKDFENIQDQSGDEMTSELGFYPSEQNDESSLRDEKDQFQDSGTYSEYNYRNNPQNMYMDPEGNLFYYVESEMPASPEQMYGVTPNDERLYFTNTNSFSDTDIANSNLLKKNSIENGQYSDSEIIEDQDDRYPEEAYAKNIKMHESDFNEFATSQEFSEADISNIQYYENDSVIENDESAPNFSTEKQSEYNGGLNEDSHPEEIDQEESQKISSGEGYKLRNYPYQNIYRDPNGNMYYYVDSEMPQGLERDNAVPANDFGFQVENINSSDFSATDSDILLKNAVEDRQKSELNILEGEDVVSGETYAQNIMQMPDEEFSNYVNSQNIYTDSEGNMFYYTNTELAEGSENLSGNFDVTTLDPLSSDISWKTTNVDGQTSVSHPEDGQPIIGPEETYVENIMKMSDAEVKEYINSQFPEENGIPDIQYSKNYAKNKKKPILANQAVTGFKYNMEDRFRLPVGEFNDTVKKWPNRSELLDSYAGIGEKTLPDQYIDHDEDLGEDSLQKRVETDFEEGLSEENNGFINTQNIYTDSAGNMFYYYPETAEGEKNIEDELHSISSDGVLDPESPSENQFSGNQKSYAAETDKSPSTLDEEYAKKIMEMSDSEFKDYLNSQGLSQELPSYEPQIEESSNEEGLQPDGSETQFSGNQKSYAEETDKSPSTLDEEDAKKIMEMSDSEFKDYLSSQGLIQELPSYEPQIEESSNEEGLQPDGSETQFSGNQKSYAKETDKSPSTLDEEDAKKIMEMSDSEFKDYLSSQGLSQELPSYEPQIEESSNEEGLQPDGSESQDYEELAQKYDIRNNPQNIFVDSQGNMYYYAVDTELPNDPEDFDNEAESSLESTANYSSNESSLPLENEFTDSANVSSNILDENETDPVAEEAYLKSIMKMSDEELGVYLSSQEFKEVTDVPDILSNKNKPKNGEQYSENQWSPVQDSMNGFQPSNYETEKSIWDESYDSQVKGKDGSMQELNAFESGTEPLAETSGLSNEMHDSTAVNDVSHTAADSANKQISEPLNSETAVESIDVNKDAQDELYGDFSDLFAALGNDPAVKGQETKDNLKLESSIAQGKANTGNTQEDLKSTGYQSSKSPGSEFDEQMAFKPLDQPSSSLVKGFGANSVPSNLKQGDKKQSSEFPPFTQGFNSFPNQGDLRVSPNQQYASPYSSQPAIKKSLPGRPKKDSQPTFGGTLRSMKSSKLQMLGLYANALRQRLF